MTPPRRWMVWLVVLGMGVVGALAPGRAVACPRQPLALPVEPPYEASGDPDVPVNPKPSANCPPPLLIAVVRLDGAEWTAVAIADWITQWPSKWLAKRPTRPRFK